MLRYMRRLEARDLSLTTSMIPLGSCTMKLNATAEMMPVTWPEFGRLHPFAPADQAAGLRDALRAARGLAGRDHRLRRGLAAAQRGLAGRVRGPAGDPRVPREPRRRAPRRVPHPRLRARHEPRVARRWPASRWWRSPATRRGNIDVDDLRKKAAAHAQDLAALMVTYPSTHGVFEETIEEICRIVHEHGGQVYMDGANMNAQVGLTRPGGHRRRRLPPEPAQDLLHPARRRRPGHGPDRRGQAPGAVPARASARGGLGRGRGRRLRRPVRQRQHPADPVDVHRDDGRRTA